MKLIKNPNTLAKRIVNAIVNDIYQRSGGDHFFDGIEDDVLLDMSKDLTKIVQAELDKDKS